ncbi:MAG: pimeloyl-ACP methyl ester esterase BioH [Gammaproteobacteria bacterium]|nr:pimeloyl-ACP methyl ester esterase BioH [Gammaproteobacteria bacterium]
MDLYIESLGDGPTMVLVHGWGLHGGVWRDLAARLARSFRVLIPDLPGHGRSRGTHTGVSLSGLADDLSRRLTEPAIWIGWSLGAFVALTTARNQPQAVSRLVLVGATPKFVQAPDWLCAMPPATLAQFARDLESDYRGTLARFLSLQIGDDATAHAAVRQLRAMLVEHGEPDPATLRSGLQWLANTDLRADLPAITAPTLVLHGSHDRLVPPAAAKFLAERLPAAQLALIPSAGHVPFLSHTDATWNALTEFLRDPKDGGGTTPGTGEVERCREPPPRATAAFDVPVSRGTCASCTSPGAVAAV